MNIKARFGFNQRSLLFALSVCPLAALTGSFFGSVLAGGAALLALVISNVVTSLLGSLPSGVKWVAHLLISAVIVCALAIVLDRFVPSFSEIKSVFPLAAVCCLVLGFVPNRVKTGEENSAKKDKKTGENMTGNYAGDSTGGAGKNVLSALVDGLVLGGAFALFSIAIGGVRQLLGSTLGIAVFGRAAGGFIVLGLMLALLSAIFAAFCTAKDKGRAE